MILMVAVDDRNGMMFNHRRQSQDRALRVKILELSSGTKLWMNHFSAKQFAKDGKLAGHLNVDDSFLTEAIQGEYCFAENVHTAYCLKWIEQVILFKWNRKYPADFWFDINLADGNWELSYSEEFEGHSHDRITMEVYDKR